MQNQHAETPAGYIDTGRKELNVRVMGEAATTGDFSRLIITGRGGSAIWKTYRINDVAQVEDGLNASAGSPTSGGGSRWASAS